MSDAAVTPESMLSQTCVVLTKLFYTQLGADTDANQTGYIWKVGLQMLGLTILLTACAIAAGFCLAKLGAGVGRDLRRDVFAKVTYFNNAEMDQFSTASLITRSTNDITQIQIVIAMGNGFPVPGHDLCAERADAGHILDRRVPDQRYCHTSGRHGGGADRRRRYPRVYIPGTV